MTSKYSDKLRDPRWQKKRLQVLEAAGWACQSCDDKEETLHVHHLRYHGEPWDAPNNELECLCESCHIFREELKSAGLATGTLPTRFWRLMVVFAAILRKYDWSNQRWKWVFPPNDKLRHGGENQ